MRWILKSIILISASTGPLSTGAYERDTHAVISTNAAATSKLASSETLQRLGLAYSIFDTQQRFPNVDGTPRTIDELLQDGAKFEDNNIRARNHFYDPFHNLPLTVGGVPLGNTSPAWALGDNGQITWLTPQEYSYSDARKYFLDALTKANKSDRDKGFGLMFQTLGQVMHHIQDMGQPQHVRNDAHLSLPYDIAVPGVTNPSAYEKYTDRNRKSLPFSGYGAVYSDSDTTTFSAPRKFWVNGGKGIAEYTNRGFVSAGTNFDKPNLFPSPVLNPASFVDVDVQNVCNSTGEPCPTLSGKVRLFGNTVEDRYTGASVYNPYASSYSVFDPEMEKFIDPSSRKNVFTLNRANFQLAQSFLIPRAVGYSAGLINYFFRGNIDLAPAPNDIGKFVIKSFTKEAMSGTFALYYDSTNGQRHPVSGASWDLSIAATDANNSPGISTPIEFTPPNDAKNPGEFMLAFNGSMGDELPGNGFIGAVIGRAVNLDDQSGLYVLGLDASNRVVSLKASRFGTKFISGYDAGGTYHATTSFDPLASAYFATSQNPPKAILKQAIFQANGIYHTVAVTLLQDKGAGQFTQSYVYDSTLGQLTTGFNSYAPAWIAKSPDATIGEFTFVASASGPNNGSLGYTRKYIDSLGVTQQESGSIPLPSLPGQIRTGYDSFPKGSLVISPDGLTVSGFWVIQDQVVTSNASELPMTYYDLVITLAAAPTASLVQKMQSSIKSVSSGEVIDTVVGKFTTTPRPVPPCNSISPPPYVGNLYHRKMGGNVTSDATYYFLVGYINGSLTSFSRNDHTDDVDVTDRPEVGGEVFGWLCQDDSTGRGWAYSRDIGYNLKYAKTTGGYTFETGNLSKQIIQGASNHGPGSGDGTNSHWDYFFEGGTALPPYTFVPFSLADTYEDYEVYRALKSNVEDVIYRKISYPGDPGTFWFKGIDITGPMINGQYAPKPHAADVSPLGEIFFGVSDLGTIIHEPMNGPKIVIPSHVTRVIAAVWL